MGLLQGSTKRDARVFNQNEETLELEEDFKIFPGYVTFDKYIELVKEEANYWKGYGPYLDKEFRAKKEYYDLEEGMELVKRATNLRQSIYNDVKLMDKAEAGSKKLEDLEKRILLKSLDVAKLREDFRYYLQNAGIDPRLRYSKKIIKEEEEKTE